MPNDNLGVAHGRIRIDVDDRGSAQATAALIKMQAQFEQMNKSLVRIDKSLKNTDYELDRTTRSMDRAGKAAKGYSSSLFDTHKSFSTFAKDSRDLVDDLQTVIVYANRAKQAFDKLATVTRFLNNSGGLSRNNGLSTTNASLMALNTWLAKSNASVAKFNDNIRQNVYENNLWGKAIRSVSSDVRDNSMSMQLWSAKAALAGAGLNNLRNKVYGIGAAVDASPNWVRKISGLVGAVAKIGTVGGVLSSVLVPLSGMENLIGTAFTKRVVGSLSSIGDKANSLGGIFARVFGDKALIPFNRFSNVLKNFGGNFDDFLVRGSTNVTRFKGSLDNGIKSMAKWVGDSKSLITSIALLTGNITKLWQRFQWFFKIPKPLMAAFAMFFSRILPTALYGVRRLLQGMSNLTAGLWNGIKQLFGGFAVIPGLIATLGAAITSLYPVFKNLSKQLADVFSDDPVVAMEAWVKLPEHLKPLAQAIKNIVPKMKELQKSLQTEAFRGIDKQINALASVYFPLFEKNALSVVAAFRRMKDAAVSFALESKSQRDFATVYQNTAGMLSQVAAATKPALEGFRDMATVGTTFLKDATAWAPYLGNKFKEWAASTRDSGQLMRWMQDARSGAYDLGKGLKDLVKSAYNLLTLFKTNNGDDFLQRFSKSMEKLSKWTKEANIDGVLSRWRRAVANLGEKNIADLNNLLKIFWQTIESFTPMIKKLSDSFSFLFVRMMTTALKVINATADAFTSLGLAVPFGAFLGFISAVRLLPKWFAASKDAIGAFVGGIQLLKNKNKVFDGIEMGAAWASEKLDKFGEKGKKLGKGVENLGESLTKTGSKIIGFAGYAAGAAAAGLVLFDLYNSATDRIEKFNAKIEASKTHLSEFKRSIEDAFAEDRGLRGRNVMSSISEGLDIMNQDIADKAQNTVKIWTHVDDLVKRVWDSKTTLNKKPTLFGELFSGDSEELDNIQKTTEQAQLANKKLKELRENGVNLEGVIASSDAGYKKFIENLRSTGAAGNLAADELDKMRKVVRDAENDARRAGDANLALSEGIKKIAESGGDAATALDGLKMAMEAVGLIKTSAVERAIAYQESLNDLKETYNELASDLNGTSNAITPEGDFNLATESGLKLAKALTQVGNSYLASAVGSKNAVAEYAKLEAELKTMAEATNIPIGALQKLSEQITGTPEEVQFYIDLIGVDAAGQDMAAFIAKAQQMAREGIQIPAELNPTMKAEDISKQINEAVGKAYGSGTVEVTSVRGGNLVIAPNLDKKTLQGVIDELAKLKINLNGGVPAEPANLPVSVTAEINEETLTKAIETMQGTLATAAQEAELKGLALGENFAEGIKRASKSVQKAALLLAFNASLPLPGSPAKIGPLSGRGWSRIRGESFGSDFASGISAGKPAVGAAALDVAGAAGQGLNSSGAYKAGQYLGQLMQLNDFFSSAVDAFGKVFEAAMGIGKFLSDPLGKGTFFGSKLGYRRDPSISDADIAKRKEDERQQRAFSFYGSATRPDLYDPATGRLKTSPAGTLNPASGKQGIANYIVDKALELGYSKAQADQFLIQAVGESGLSPNASNPNGWEGIFQFDKSTWEQAGGGDMFDAAKNIENYFNLAAQRGLTPENFTQGSQLGTQVSIGGPWHPENAAKGHLSQAQANAQEYIKNYQQFVGQTMDGLMAGIPAAIGNLPKPSKLVTGPGFSAGGTSLAAVLEQSFPGITQMGGQENRPAGTPQIHTLGRALDIGIGTNLALGDAINSFITANAAQFGVQSTIWRNIGRNLVTNEGGAAGTTYTADGHFDHVHVQFANGATAQVGPDGVLNYQIPSSVTAGPNFGLPPKPEEDLNQAPTNLVMRNPDPNGEPFIPVHGTGDQPGPEVKNNPLTGLPWTKEQSAEFWNRPENALQYDASNIKPGDTTAAGIFQGTQEDMLKALDGQNGLLSGILYNTSGMPDMTEAQAMQQANILQNQIQKYEQMDTAQSRAQASALGSALSNLTETYGLSENQSPIDQASQIASSMTSIASDVFAVIGSSIEAIGATKNIADTLVRGVANTEDIYNMVDQVQTFIKLGADIAGAVSSITGAIGSIAGASGGMDMGASSAIQAVGQIAGFVQAGLETANAVIDLGQQAYRIIGSYVGDFLGYLTGGAGGQLAGNVKYLLDEKTNELLAYSVDNPGDKRAHNLAGQYTDPSARNQQIGQINVYGGPGQDPRDSTRQMMFQVRASQFASATGQ